MFGLFKKKTEVEKRQSINRTDSDKEYLKADNILKKIESLQAKK
jgi:hypothetical protein